MRLDLRSIIHIPGAQQDFSYELECDAGQILFGGSDGGNQGVHWEKEIENPGGKNVELECRAGVIAVDYWDGQAAEQYERFFLQMIFAGVYGDDDKEKERTNDYGFKSEAVSV